MTETHLCLWGCNDAAHFGPASSAGAAAASAPAPASTAAPATGDAPTAPSASRVRRLVRGLPVAEGVLAARGSGLLLRTGRFTRQAGEVCGSAVVHLQGNANS